MNYYEDPEYHNKLENAKTGMGLGFTNLFFSILQVIQLIISLLGLIFITINGHWLVPFIVLAAGIPVLWVQRKHNVERYSLVFARTPKKRLMGYLSSLLTTRDAVKEVRLYRLGQYIVDKWKNTFEEVRIEAFKLAVKQRLWLALRNYYQFSDD